MKSKAKPSSRAEVEPSDEDLWVCEFSPEYARYIANIASDWGTLETYVNEAIWMLADLRGGFRFRRVRHSGNIEPQIISSTRP